MNRLKIIAKRVIWEPISSFVRRLNSHDWFYYYSDDHRVYTAGLRAEQEINALAKHSSDLDDILRMHCKKQNAALARRMRDKHE